ncbi:MAG: hypothetical protein LUE92_15750, partial [Clostridiales bacterium]|nr:hypothetical protein [Clostridiales bacterium]
SIAMDFLGVQLHFTIDPFNILSISSNSSCVLSIQAESLHQRQYIAFRSLMRWQYGHSTKSSSPVSFDVR